MSLKFKIEKQLPDTLARAGVIETAHGNIETPAFVVVGTKATVKSLTPEQVVSLGAQVTLANTYHLYLQPGDELIARAGGLHQFMNWPGPMMTDSGGFQAFSLGVALGEGISKLSRPEASSSPRKKSLDLENDLAGLRAKVTEDGVTFKSVIDGSAHEFTPEKSIEIQHNLGADIIFAFDECTSPTAPYEYQQEAMERTHRWAKRSLTMHDSLKATSHKPISLYGIVQGGRFPDLREASAKYISSLDFDGFGIGGSFDEQDMDTVVGLVNSILPESKPRHLLGIGEPKDFFRGIENGVDTFDCVAATRMARNGNIQTKKGRINILNAQYRNDLAPLEEGCGCYTCSPRHGEAGYTRAYLAHLFRAKEMLAATLASIHNLYFSVNLVKQIRQSIVEGNLRDFKTDFLAGYSR